jgi:hypothetical protein
VASVAFDSSLVRSGPFFRCLCRSKLIRHDRRDVLRQALWLLAITWMPIVVLELVRFGLYGGGLGILRSISVHARFLIAMPLVLVAEEGLHRTCRRTITAFAEGDFVTERDADPTVPLVERATKLTGAPVLESFLAVLCFASEIVIWVVTKKTGLLFQADAEATLSPARAWYAFVGLPLLNFLSLRLLYRWLIWAWLLRKLSALPLRIVPTHPDKAGGLGFLVQPTLAFAVFLSALSAVMASVWAERSIAEGIPVTNFSDEFSVIVILGEVAAFAPLASFAGSLLHTRLEGLIEYGKLGLRYTRAFNQRWVETPRDEGLLGTSDIQSLADLANSFGVVERMRVVPFSPRHVIGVFIAMAAPMLPLVLTEVPVHSLLQNVGRTLLGGLPP